MNARQPTVSVSWDQVLSWRLSRQHLDPMNGGSAVEIARRLIQQVAAELADVEEMRGA